MFNDNQIIIKLIAESIREERNRIVSLGILTDKVCDDYIKSGTDEALVMKSEADVADYLFIMHSKLSNVKLAGDVIELELIPIEMPEDKGCSCGANEDTETEEYENEGDDEMKDTESAEEDEFSELLDEICNELNEMASDIGEDGAHELAHSLEKAATILRDKFVSNNNDI